MKETDRVEVMNLESRLFGGLAKARVFGRLTGVDVAAGLNPDPKTLVEVEDNAARGDHKGSYRQVMLVRPFVKRIAGPGEAIQGPLDGVRLSLVHRRDSFNLRPKDLETH
jgi:hypothetical protein